MKNIHLLVPAAVIVILLLFIQALPSRLVPPGSTAMKRESGSVGSREYTISTDLNINNYYFTSGPIPIHITASIQESPGSFYLEVYLYLQDTSSYYYYTTVTLGSSLTATYNFYPSTPNAYNFACYAEDTENSVSEYFNFGNPQQKENAIYDNAGPTYSAPVSNIAPGSWSSSST